MKRVITGLVCLLTLCGANFCVFAQEPVALETGELSLTSLSMFEVCRFMEIYPGEDYGPRHIGKTLVGTIVIDQDTHCDFEYTINENSEKQPLCEHYSIAIDYHQSSKNQYFIALYDHDQPEDKMKLAAVNLPAPQNSQD